MISICTVSLECIQRLEALFLESIARKTKHVTEVIVVRQDFDSSFYKEEKLLNRPEITIKYVGRPENRSDIPNDGSWGHSTALHKAMEYATGEYLWMSDPDLFFYCSVDEIYLELMKKHDLWIIGISFEHALNVAQQFFPIVQNILMDRSKMPPNNFLNGTPVQLAMPYADDNTQTVINNNYLVCGPTIPHYKSFPAPDKNFDTACNLWLWNKEINGRWLSFQTLDTHLYCTGAYKANFKIKDKLGNKKLLYHLASSCQKLQGDSRLEVWNDYNNKYMESLNEN